MTRPYHYDMPSVAPKGASELNIQKSMRERIAKQFPACRWVAIPNGTYTASVAARGRAKAEGAAKGFPDAMIIGLGKIAFVEVKAQTPLKTEQDEWLSWLAGQYHCGVFRHQDTLAAKLLEWGFPSNTGWRV